MSTENNEIRGISDNEVSDIQSIERNKSDCTEADDKNVQCTQNDKHETMTSKDLQLDSGEEPAVEKELGTITESNYENVNPEKDDQVTRMEATPSYYIDMDGILSESQDKNPEQDMTNSNCEGNKVPKNDIEPSSDILRSLDVGLSYCIDADSIFSNAEEEPVQEKKPVSSMTCWNCEGNHNLSECPNERDYKAIARNKKLFMKAKPIPNVRYHEDTEQKYAGIKPGVISKKLKEALGLQEWQAPEFIYRMRVLGYPPGWLKDAEVHRAEVSLIDEDGSALSHPEDEEGEVDTGTVKYEPDRLVSYPGFNVPFDECIMEEGRYYNCPDMLHCHSRSEFERIMKENRAVKYKRKRQEATGFTKRLGPTHDDLEEMDTSADVTDEKLQSKLRDNTSLHVAEEEAQEKPATDNDKSPETDAVDMSADEPTRPIIETALALPEEPPKGELATEEESVNDNRLLANNASSTDEAASPTRNPAVTTEPTTPMDSPVTPVGVNGSSRRLHSKSFNFGVGIPGASVTTVTPPTEKWSVGISDHIDFANAPDSTGKWDKMKRLMGRVRLQMTNVP